MGAARPLLGLVLAVVITLSVYALGHHLVRHRLPAASAAPPQGFAGWLLLLAAGQWIAALWLLAALVHSAPWLAGAGASLQLRPLGHLVLLALVLGSTLQMTRRSRLYPRLLRLELVLLVVLPPVDALWFPEETSAYVTEPKLWIAFAVRLVVIGTVAAVWYLYSQHSLRMRATFIGRGRATFKSAR